MKTKIFPLPAAGQTGPMIAAAALCAFVLPPAASAQDWQVSPDITLTGTYNDNARLQIDSADQDKLQGGKLDGQVRFSRRSPTGLLLFIPRATTTYYSSDPEDESDDYFLFFDGAHNTQKSIWSFRTRYSAQDVRTAEVDDPDFDDPDIDRPITDDSGQVQLIDRRFRFTISPGAAFQISPRSTIELIGDYTDASYDLNAGQLTDYTNGNLQLSLIRQTSEQNSISLSLSGGRFEADVAGFTSDTYGARVQFARQISETSSAFVYAGFEQVKSDFDFNGIPDSSSDTTFVGGAGMTREYETSRVVLDVRHAVDPSGIGQLTERTQFRAVLTKQLSPLLTARIDARYQQQDIVPASLTRPDRDYAQVRLGLSRALNPSWSVVAEYAYARQEFSTVSGNASSNSASLGVRYAPPRRN